MALVSVLALCVPRLLFARLRGPLTLERRALWGQATGRQLITALRIRISIEGKPPAGGLLVANHLSYLDILIFGTVTPCFFVSKAEIGRWPFFGWMSRAGGTLYVERSSRTSAASVARQIGERLNLPACVLLFPEGTSTAGSQVLRFHPTLFEPAIVAGAPVTAASVRYVIDGGVPERELCWFDDSSFVSHLWRALGTAGITAEVRFGEPQVYPDRRIAAEQTHAEIDAMRSGDPLVFR